MNVTVDVFRGDETLDLDLVSAIANYGSKLSKGQKFATIANEEILVEPLLETGMEVVDTASNVRELGKVDPVLSVQIADN